MNAQTIIQQSTKSFLDTLESAKKIPKESLLAKTSSKPWSVLDILEHVLIVEHRRITDLEQIIQKIPVDVTQSPKPTNRQFSDTQELWNGSSNRKLKIIAPDYASPKGTLTSLESFEQEFGANRNRMIAFLASHSEGQLHNCYLEHRRVGFMDACEWLIYLCGHGEKHRQQLEELLLLQGVQ